MSGFAGGGGGADEAAVVGAGRSAGGYPGRAVTNARLEREYVWGPGDGLAGVDELFARYGGVSVGSGTSAADGAGTGEAAGGRAAVFWSIQDGGGDVVALCDSGGPLVSTGAQSGSSQPTSLTTGRVVGQWVYGAYGDVLVAEDLQNHPTMHVGHKGLFVDRLDEGMTTSGTDPPAARLEPFAQSLYYARNRHYSPGMGRWMQRDPNATADVIVDFAAWHGRAIAVVPDGVQSFDDEARAVDGRNLYAYLRGRPSVGNDPLGLLLSLIGPTSMLELQTNQIQHTLETGKTIVDSLNEKFGSYAFDQVLDANWASNWDEADDLYSRSAQHEMHTGSWRGSDPAAAAMQAELGPMRAGLVDQVIGKFSDELLDGTGVYLIFDEAGKILYSGRSKNVARRAAQQLAKYGPQGAKQVRTMITGSVEAARALEDLVIRRKQLIDGGLNAINGISMANKNRKAYYRALRTFLTHL